MAFADRRDAGRQLAALLMESGSIARRPRSPQPTEDTAVVMGMARGGVPVAYEVAAALHAPLDVVVVRKLGHPRQPELGLGAIAEDGVRVVNDALVGRLAITEDVIDAVAARQTLELERRLRVYRGDRPP